MTSDNGLLQTTAIASIWQRGLDNTDTIQGIRRGLNVTWELGIKVVLPAYIVVSLLNYTPVIKWLSSLLEPMMHLIGLPGSCLAP